MNECAKAMLNHYVGSECSHLRIRSFMNTGIRLVFKLCSGIICYSSHALVHIHPSADDTMPAQRYVSFYALFPQLENWVHYFWHQCVVGNKCPYTLLTKLKGLSLVLSDDFVLASARFFSQLLILLIG